MNPMTTHQLGQRPGRARLGAFDRVRPVTIPATNPASNGTAVRGNWYAAAWSTCPSNATAGFPTPLAKGDMGFGTGTGVKGTTAIAHLSRHLGVRTT